ncbi:unnamed protein product, partial [Rotaria sp. Silwood1]
MANLVTKSTGQEDDQVDLDTLSQA